MREYCKHLLGILEPDQNGELRWLFDETNKRFPKEEEEKLFIFCPNCGKRLRNEYIDEKGHRRLSIISLSENDISLWFGLTYASYLVIPRLWLEAMPHEWQLSFVHYLEQIPETLEIDDTYEASYSINYKVKGKFTKDPYRDYRRGLISLKK